MHVCEIAGGKCQCHSIMYQGKTQKDMNSSLCAALSASRFRKHTTVCDSRKAFVFAAVLFQSVIIVSVRTSTQRNPTTQACVNAESF